MLKENKHSSVGEGLERLNKSTQKSSRIANFIGRLHSVNGLYIISAIMQVFLGISVVILSLINSIQPLWLATFMAVFGSIVTMTGFYFLYQVINHSGAFDSLLHKAIKRVVNSQN